jgi:hypothetical protein
MTMFAKRMFFLTLTMPFLVFLSAAEAPGAEPELLSFPSFAVTPATAAGEEADSFGSRDIPHFNMQFALALSATRTYSVRITLIQDASGKIAEKQVYEGTLDEGIYSFLIPGEPPPGYGDINAKIVMRVRMFRKKFTGDDFYIYRRWEGTYRYGK